MNSRLHNVTEFWNALSAANPVVQTLEGVGTNPQFRQPEPSAAPRVYSQRPGSSFKPDI